MTFASRRACVDVDVAESALSARPLSVRSSAMRASRSRRAPLDPRLDARADAATASANAPRSLAPSATGTATRGVAPSRAVRASSGAPFASSSGDAIGASA